jgi:preprotein translocase subunit SecY
MLSAFLNTFKIKELRGRILFTLGLVFICRLIVFVPLPGVSASIINDWVSASGGGAGGGLLGLMNLFSGGAMMKCSIGTLGIMPYISASIIIQLMSGVIPHLEKLKREGDVGHQKITQYTRYLTVFICAEQAGFMAVTLKSGNYFGLPASVVQINMVGFFFLCIISLVTGSLLLMWIGEQITARGIGNGISLIITINIVSRLPNVVQLVAMKMGGENASIGPFHIAFMTLAGAVFLTIIAVMPNVMNKSFDVSWTIASFFGGTSLLIMVGVMLDTMRQVESHLLMHHYDGFLKKGKMRGRR